MTRVYLEAAQLAGHDLNPISTAADRMVSASIRFTQRSGQRVTAEGAYLDPVRDRPNLTVIPDTQVTKVLFEGATATGVAWKRGGETGTIAARETILAAGAFVSPAAPDAVRHRQGPRPCPTRHRAGARSDRCRREPPGSPRRHAGISRQIRYAVRDFLESASTQYPARP